VCPFVHKGAVDAVHRISPGADCVARGDIADPQDRPCCLLLLGEIGEGLGSVLCCSTICGIIACGFAVPVELVLTGVLKESAGEGGAVSLSLSLLMSVVSHSELLVSVVSSPLASVPSSELAWRSSLPRTASDHRLVPSWGLSGAEAGANEMAIHDFPFFPFLLVDLASINLTSDHGVRQPGHVTQIP